MKQPQAPQTFSSCSCSSHVGLLFPSSMPESELEVLVEVSLSDLSAASWPPLKGRFCRGRGTGGTCVEPEPRLSPLSALATVSFLRGGVGEACKVVLGLGTPTEQSPSKLVWHGSFTGD